MIKDPSVRNLIKSQYMEHWSLGTHPKLQELKSWFCYCLQVGFILFICVCVCVCPRAWEHKCTHALRHTWCTYIHTCKSYCTNLQFRGQHTVLSSHLWVPEETQVTKPAYKSPRLTEASCRLIPRASVTTSVAIGSVSLWENIHST